MDIEKLIGQKQTPVCTVISLFISFVVWVVILEEAYRAPAPEGSFFPLRLMGLIAVVVYIGLPANILAGLIASARGEYCGGQIAVLGIALWFLTGLLILARKICCGA